MRNPALDECEIAPSTLLVADESHQSLDDFDRFDFPAPIRTGEVVTRTVYTKGTTSRPGVLIMHELPGFTWQCTRLARIVHDSGFRVYVPLLFGEPNVRGNTLWLSTRNIARSCVRRHFTLLARKQSSPITDWLRALGHHIRHECTSESVGAIGMCLTGGFALSLLLDSDLVAPVLCQPSLPFSSAQDLGYSDTELAAIQSAVRGANIPVRAYRFAHDIICRKGKLDALETALPTLVRWEPKGCKHATVTHELGHKPEAACIVDDILIYLHQQLDGPRHRTVAEPTASDRDP